MGDSRNDENAILSQLHVALLRFHNAVVDRLRAQPEHAGATSRQLFELARRSVTWHYQWCIVHEFLPLTIGASRVERLLAEGNRYYRPERRRDAGGHPLLPNEFSVAAYRFGHSQIRPTCAAASGRRAASSTGRPSSTSAMATCGPTSASTPGSRRRC